MSSNLSTENLFPVHGLVAVVTGAGSGIGSMITRALATNGASAVYAVDIEKDGIERLAQDAVTFPVRLQLPWLITCLGLSQRVPRRL